MVSRVSRDSPWALRGSRSNSLLGVDAEGRKHLGENLASRLLLFWKMRTYFCRERK